MVACNSVLNDCSSWWQWKLTLLQDVCGMWGKNEGWVSLNDNVQDPGFPRDSITGTPDTRNAISPPANGKITCSRHGWVRCYRTTLTTAFCKGKGHVCNFAGSVVTISLKFALQQKSDIGFYVKNSSVSSFYFFGREGESQWTKEKIRQLSQKYTLSTPH